MKKTNKKELVVKDNELNNYTFYKSSVQLKIFSKIILAIREDIHANEYTFPIKKIFKDFGGSKENYTQLKKVCKQMNQTIEIPKEKGFQLSVLFVNIDSSGSGYITFEVNEKLKPYLTNLDNSFTQYYFRNISKLKSYYSIRIYELLKQFQKKDNSGWWKTTIIGLREKLNIDNKKYKLFADFRRKVILQAQKELKEHTDIKFTFETEKSGRKIDRIIFYIQLNIKIKKIENKVDITVNKAPIKEEKDISKIESNQEKSNSSLVLILRDKLKLDEAFINEIFSMYDETKILNNANHTLNELSAGKIKNSIGGFLRTALKYDYANQKTLFSDVENNLKKDKNQAIREQEALNRKKRDLEEFKIQKIKLLTKDFEDLKRKIIFDYVEKNPKEIHQFYCDIKNSGKYSLSIKEDVELENIIEFVKNITNMPSIIFRSNIYQMILKSPLDFINFCKDEGFEVFEEYSEFRIK